MGSFPDGFLHQFAFTNSGLIKQRAPLFCKQHCFFSTYFLVSDSGLLLAFSLL